jgi:hypothetical protein
MRYEILKPNSTIVIGGVGMQGEARQWHLEVLHTTQHEIQESNCVCSYVLR